MPGELLATLRGELREIGDPVRAPQMQAYMKSAMPYHGVTAPLLRKTCKAVFQELEFADAEAWREAALAIWRGAQYREERYAAIGLTGVRQAAGFQTMDAVEMYDEMIVSGAWWDYVDAIASQRIGKILQEFPRPMKKLMRQWSRGDNLWKRRTSIICQLGARSATDLKLLYDCIDPSLEEKEFFLRKGIGWALRQYAWTDAEEVVRYVKEKGDRMSPLARREALKNVVLPRGC